MIILNVTKTQETYLWKNLWWGQIDPPPPSAILGLIRIMISALETNKEIESFKEENVQIIEKLVTVLETDKEMIPSLRDVPKEKIIGRSCKG